MKPLPVAAVLLLAVLAGCIEVPEAAIDPTPGPEIKQPLCFNDPANDTDCRADYRALPAKVTKLKAVAKGSKPGGQGIWLWDHMAYVSTGSSQTGVNIYDITDPLAPTLVGNITGHYARDADILNYGNRTVLVTASGSSGVGFFDVTDPTEIKDLGIQRMSAHNIAVHRPGKVVYNSRSLGSPPGGAEILDASNPEAITSRVWNFERVAADGSPVANTGCHDVMVYPEVHRAYCAAITQTLIWDIRDPLNPKVLSAIENPLINIHHSAFTILNHTVLVIGDEYGGAALYACYGSVTPPVGGTVSTPTGAIWFYDLTTPVPTLLSWISPPIARPPATCTAHFGSEIGQGTGMVAYGWYSAGTLLVDATNPLMPRLVESYPSAGSTWDSRYYRGYVFTGDGSLGLGVFEPM
jgi:hypothetical protein